VHTYISIFETPKNYRKIILTLPNLVTILLQVQNLTAVTSSEGQFAYQFANYRDGESHIY